MKSQELRFTETNSADDSQGKTWGLDGNLFWYIAGGSFVSVITLLLLFSALRMSFLMASGIAAVPFTLTLAYVFGFRQGKPPGYDVDCFDFWFSGAGFGPELARQPSHPLEPRHV
jgi:hypothetical protein